MNRDIIKVVWVCAFSNSEIRSHLNFSVPFAEKIIRKLLKQKPASYTDDFALWNTRGIQEFKHFHNVELHIISFAHCLKNASQEFTLDGIHYYFYKDDADYFSNQVKRFLFKKDNFIHTKGNSYIIKKINEIQPDIIHLIGAENFYSTFVLNYAGNIPTLVHLQTLLSAPGFLDGYPFLDKETYNYRANLEKQILCKCDYIGTESQAYKEIILNSIAPSAIILNMDLATGITVSKEKKEIQFDFVYFAHGISKAFDFALEGFAIAARQRPNLTLDVVGSYSEDYKKQMDERIEQLGVKNNIFFEGEFASHEDVIQQIMKSRYALLPFKVDANPTTIPEAMSCGLPVISTSTEGIAQLYDNEVDILLSDIGDHEALAHNIIRIIDDTSLSDSLRKNAFMRIKKDSNTTRMENWLNVYRAIQSKKLDGTTIDQSLYL